MATVYLETSFFSECVTIRSDPIDLGRRATSLRWWKSQSSAFELVISGEVVRELSNPNFPDVVRNEALGMLRGLTAVALSDDVYRVAELLVKERVMPGPAVEGDAVHAAACVVHRINHLLPWNQKHLANPNKRLHMAAICARLRLPVPELVTPDLLIMEGTDDRITDQ